MKHPYAISVLGMDSGSICVINYQHTFFHVAPLPKFAITTKKEGRLPCTAAAVLFIKPKSYILLSKYVKKSPVHRSNVKICMHTVVVRKACHISPYTIFAAYDRCSPDLRTVSGQTLYLFGSPTHGTRLFLVPSNFIHSENEPKTLLTFDCHFIHCIVAVSQFFCG